MADPAFLSRFAGKVLVRGDDGSLDGTVPLAATPVIRAAPTNRRLRASTGATRVEDVSPLSLILLSPPISIFIIYTPSHRTS